MGVPYCANNFYPPTLGTPRHALFPSEHSLIVCGQRAREPPSFYNIFAILLADSTVLSSNIAIVIGPTPPGTGLIQPAF